MALTRHFFGSSNIFHASLGTANITFMINAMLRRLHERENLLGRKPCGGFCDGSNVFRRYNNYVISHRNEASEFMQIEFGTREMFVVQFWV